MALLSTYQKFKEKNTHGGQSEPQKQETQKENSGSGLMSTFQQFMSKKQRDIPLFKRGVKIYDTM